VAQEAREEDAVKHLPWHKVWHDRLLSDPDYLSLPPAARGVLVDLRCFAARQAEAGETGHTEKRILRWYGGNRNSVQTALKLLRNRGLIEVKTESGIISIPRWVEAQETLAAARKRRQRARDKDRDGHADVTEDVTGEAEAEAEFNKQVEREESAKRILEAYAKLKPPSFDNSRSRAKNHLLKLLKKHGEAKLLRAVTNYATQEIEPRFRRNSGNFFGRDADWIAFSDPKWKPETDTTTRQVMEIQ